MSGEEQDDSWKAFWDTEEAEQKYWVVEWEEEYAIYQRFDDLMTCLRPENELIIYSTLSPSADESRDYLGLLGKHSNLSLTIKIASMILEDNDGNNRNLKELSEQENVVVEAFQGSDDWENLSNCLDQGYTEEEYDEERKEQDRRTNIALQQALRTEDAIWRAFLKGEEAGQRYWFAEWEQNSLIYHKFDELQLDLRTHSQDVEKQNEFTIYSTSSPLAMESTDYMTLQKEHPHVSLTIKIASLENKSKGKLKELSRLRNVAVEAFQRFDDWKNLSTHLHRNYTSRDYVEGRKKKDIKTSIKLQQALGTEDRNIVLQHFRYSGAHTSFETSEKYWAVEIPDNYRRVYKSRKLGRPPLRRGLQGLIRDLQDELLILRKQPEQQKFNITLYCSLSPVEHECKKIREFVDINKDVILKIKIAGLYRVYRATCERNSLCNKGRHKPPNATAKLYYKKNATALMNIHLRVTVEAFSGCAEWVSLVQVINDSSECHGVAAGFTKKDYKSRCCGETTRIKEDSSTKEDLEELSNNEKKKNKGKDS